MSKLMDLRERFEELDDAGRSAVEIARALNINPRTVARWRAQMDRVKTPAVERRPDSDRERARTLIEDGCSLTEVARTLRVTLPTVKRWFPDAHRCTQAEAGEYAALHRYELRLLPHETNPTRRTA